MNYTPTEWNTGDIVSSQRLNKLEEGVKGAYEVMVININIENGELDKTWQEIYDAMAQMKLCVVRTDTGNLEEGILIDMVRQVCVVNGTEYLVDVDDTTGFSASSATGYPLPRISDDTPVGGGGAW